MRSTGVIGALLLCRCPRFANLRDSSAVRLPSDAGGDGGCECMNGNAEVTRDAKSRSGRPTALKGSLFVFFSDGGTSGVLDAHISRFLISLSASRLTRASEDPAIFASDASGMLRAITRSGRKRSATSDRNFPARLFRGRSVTKSPEACASAREPALRDSRPRSAPNTRLPPAGVDGGCTEDDSTRLGRASHDSETGASFCEDVLDTRMIGHRSCWIAQKLDLIARVTQSDLGRGLQQPPHAT